MNVRAARLNISTFRRGREIKASQINVFLAPARRMNMNVTKRHFKVSRIKQNPQIYAFSFFINLIKSGVILWLFIFCQELFSQLLCYNSYNLVAPTEKEEEKARTSSKPNFGVLSVLRGWKSKPKQRLDRLNRGCHHTRKQ